VTNSATTTNGAALTSNGTTIFVPAESVVDAFTYTARDNFGGTNTGTVVILLNNTNRTGQTSATVATTDTNATVTFFGVAGYQYATDRSTNLTTGLGWVPVSTNTPTTSGVIQVTDDFSNIGLTPPPIPSPVFYRLRYQP
jgi:hypothetical protein